MKVLIIDNWGPHFFVGGTELYCSMLIDLLKNNNCEIDEICLIEGENKKDEEHKINLFYFGLVNIKNIFKRNKVFVEKIDDFLTNNYDYDFIIFNTIFFSKKTNFHNIPVIVIQHLHPLFYWFANKIYPINGLKNKAIKNIVCYTEYDKKKMLKYFPDKKIFTVPLPYFFSSNRPVNCEKPNNIGVFGRLNNKQKNIILACKISKYLNCKILLYGSNGSNDEKIHQLVKKYPNIEYKGGYKREDLPEIYKNIKYQLVPSKFEGFGYVCVEALANSVPLIVRDTFPSASFLIDGKNNGIKFKKHTFPRKIAKLIENFISKNNYQNMQKKCYEFYSKYLTIEKFNEAWMKIINEIKS